MQEATHKISQAFGRFRGDGTCSGVALLLRVIDLQTEEEVRNDSVEVFRQCAGRKWHAFSSVSSLKSVHVSEVCRSQGHLAKKPRKQLSAHV